MNLNAKVESPCRASSDWGFCLVLEDGSAVPVGTYSTYRDGAAHANAALANTPRAVRWEAQRLYYPLTTEEAADA